MKPKVYIETTIISYLTARPSRDLRVAAHQQTTYDWWQERRLAFDLYVSQFVVQEARLGDQEAAKSRMEVLENLHLLEIKDEALLLAQKIVRQNLIPQKQRRMPPTSL